MKLKLIRVGAETPDLLTDEEAAAWQPNRERGLCERGAVFPI